MSHLGAGNILFFFIVLVGVVITAAFLLESGAFNPAGRLYIPDEPTEPTGTATSAGGPSLPTGGERHIPFGPQESQQAPEGWVHDNNLFFDTVWRPPFPPTGWTHFDNPAMPLLVTSWSPTGPTDWNHGTGVANSLWFPPGWKHDSTWGPEADSTAYYPPYFRHLPGYGPNNYQQTFIVPPTWVHRSGYVGGNSQSAGDTLYVPPTYQHDVDLYYYPDSTRWSDPGNKRHITYGPYKSDWTRDAKHIEVGALASEWVPDWYHNSQGGIFQSEYDPGGNADSSGGTPVDPFRDPPVLGPIPPPPPPAPAPPPPVIE